MSDSLQCCRLRWTAVLTLLTASAMATAMALGGCQSAPTTPPAVEKAASTQAPAQAAPTQAPAAKVAPTQAPSAQAAPTQAPAAKAAPTPAVEQKLTVGIGMIPKTLDPHLDSAIQSMVVYSMLYDSLLRVDDMGNVVPGLAEAWKNLDDQTWQFKLRKGVKFHNGEPFNAAAAQANLNRVRDPQTKSVWAGRFSPVDRVDVVDDYTINVHTKNPWATLTKNLHQVYVVPPGYLKEKGDAAFGNAPAGTGPFRFKEWKQDNYITLEANPDYWEGAPKLKTVTVRAFPEDPTLLAAVEKGEIDMAYNVPPDDVERLRSKGLTIVSRPMSHATLFLLRATMGGPLAKKEVRQALNYAVDKQVIVDKLLGGHGRVLEGQTLGPEAFGYNPNLKAYPYDPARAKKLLADAGYPNGFKVKMHGTIGRWIKDKEVTEAVATQLADVGVQVELEFLDSAVWYDLWIKGTSGPIVTNATSWAPMLDPESWAVYYVSGKEGRNILESPQYDALYRKQQVTLDPKEREKVLQELLEVFHDEVPQLLMHRNPGLYAINKKVQDVDFTAYYAMKNLTGIYIR